MQLGKFKQELIRINNKINMDIFGSGFIWQKVDIIGNRVCILSKSKKMQPLYAIAGSDRVTANVTTLALMEEFKNRFIEILQDDMNVSVLSYLKDYDLEGQVSFSMIIFEQDVEEIIVNIP